MMDDKKKGEGEDADVKMGVDRGGGNRSSDESNAEDKPVPEPPTKVAKKEKASSPKKKQGPSKGTYPKPKNFAERMMNVLENGVYPEVVSWHGEDDLVSVSIKGVKQTDILDDRFQGIKYAAFVRNLSRWGFRKVPKMDAPDGVVIYRNSLFQRANPHLVRHMKIDSDVQDIFGQHQRSAVQPDSQQHTQSDQMGAPGPLHQQQSQVAGIPLRESSINLLTQLIAQQRQQQQAQQATASLSAQVNDILQRQSQSGPRTPDGILTDIVSLSRQYLEVAPQAGSSTLESIKSLLRLVIGLATDHLRARDPDGTTPDERSPAPQSVISQVLAPQQQQQQQAQPQRPPQTIQELLLAMGQAQSQAQAQPQAAPAPQHQGSLIESIQQQVARQEQQQQQQQQQAQPQSSQLNIHRLLSQTSQPGTSASREPHQDVGSASDLQSLLTGTGSSSREGQQQSTSTRPDSIQSLLSQASGIAPQAAGGGASLNPQLLLQLQQQFQQQQQSQGDNSNQVSPPGNDCRPS